MRFIGNQIEQRLFAGKAIIVLGPRQSPCVCGFNNKLELECDKMNQIFIEYSQNLPDSLQVTKREFEEEAKMAMAVKLFEMKRLSSGLAASLAGMERTSFLLNLHRYNVPMIDLEEDQLLSDVNNA